MKKVRFFEIFGLVAVLALTGIACVSNTVNANGEKLEGVTWVLKAYGEPGSLTAAVVGHEPTLTFDKDKGKIGGNGGVNSYGGNYELKGDDLTMSDIVSTLMASTRQSLNDQENAFFNILRSAESYDIDDGEMTITGTAGVLVFEEKEQYQGYNKQSGGDIDSPFFYLTSPPYPLSKQQDRTHHR